MCECVRAHAFPSQIETETGISRSNESSQIKWVNQHSQKHCRNHTWELFWNRIPAFNLSQHASLIDEIESEPPHPRPWCVQCAGLPSMHSASAQLDSPRCHAALVAYRTPDDWSSQGHALCVARFQVPDSRGSAASPLYLQSPPPPHIKTQCHNSS